MAESPRSNIGRRYGNRTGKQTEQPKYPLKTELNGEMLKKEIPKRWMKSPAVKAALGTLAVVTLAGCNFGGAPMPISSATEGNVIVSPTAHLTPQGTPEAPMINVAPLFIHGEGRGTFGCDMVAPPAFISEHEAMTVINEVAQEYGLEFTSDDAPQFYNVLQPASDPNPELSQNPEITKQPDKIITLQADFTDKEHGIAIEYVSSDDVKEWQQWPITTSVEMYDMKDAADQLSDSLEEAAHREPGFYTIGVFYDPCEYSKDEAEAVESSKEQLKAQAKDFFKWLKQQGVI